MFLQNVARTGRLSLGFWIKGEQSIKLNKEDSVDIGSLPHVLGCNNKARVPAACFNMVIR